MNSCIVLYFWVTCLIIFVIHRFPGKQCLVYMLGIWIRGSLSASLKMNFVCLELFEGVIYLTSWLIYCVFCFQC